MINWIKPRANGPNVHSVKSKFRFSNQKGGGKNRTQSVIFIHETAMKELRWVIGDKVVFAIESNAVHMKRVTEKGFTLSAATGGKKDSTLGTMGSSSVKSSNTKFDFSDTVYADKYTVNGDVVTINFPEKK